MPGKEEITKSKEYIALNNTLDELKTEASKKQKEASFLIAEATCIENCIRKLQDKLNDFVSVIVNKE